MWVACSDDAIKRESFWQRKQAFLETLPSAEKARLEALSTEPKTSNLFPGTERSQRSDQEDSLFMASLPDA